MRRLTTWRGWPWSRSHFRSLPTGGANSTARRLRERFGFTGEIRASGNVLVDQIPLLLRAGFDAFEIVEAATIAALERGELPAVSRVDQDPAHGSSIVWHHRTMTIDRAPPR